MNARVHHINRSADQHWHTTVVMQYKMSQRLSQRVPKKKQYKDYVQGAVFPTPPKKLKKGLSAVATATTDPVQPVSRISNAATTSNTTGPKKAQRKGKKRPLIPCVFDTPNLFSEDLFDTPAPQTAPGTMSDSETYIDSPKSRQQDPTSPQNSESYMDSPNSRASTHNSETQLPSVTPDTPDTVLRAPLHTSTPVNRKRARSAQVYSCRSPIQTRASTPQVNIVRTPVRDSARNQPDHSHARLSDVARNILRTHGSKVTHSLTQTRITRGNRNGTPRQISGRIPKEFQKVVVETLIDIRDELRRLNTSEEMDSPPDQINNEVQFRKVSEDLEDPRFRRSMISQLSRIGGKDATTCTRKILDRLFTNGLMSTFNLHGGGQQGKKAFKSSAFYSVVNDAVLQRFKDATQEVVNTAMSQHFKQAPARSGGGGYRKK